VISVVTSVLNLFTGDYRQVDTRRTQPREPKVINPPE
jgi:hypothetical protein